MDLVPVREQPAETEATATESEAEAGPSPALFTVSPERQQPLGVQFTEVDYQDMEKIIRTVGLIELDERKIAHVHTKISGWIEKVFIDFTWQQVKRGDPLFTIYSPELVATQEEYLLALKAQETLKNSPFPNDSEGAVSLLDAARRRLLLWDITEDQIAELERTKKVQRTLTIHSPIAGHVIHKNAFPNMRVEPETRVYTVADHSYVWVHADIYENEMALVKLGQHATMVVPSFPDEVFRGKVTYIWPHVQGSTRTAKVRLEFPNPDLKLKPEMYANVEMHIPLGRRLVVPESAVLRTGKRNLVFVDRGEGRMEVRDIALGVKASDRYEVLRGLKPGEQVVTAANFLIDAESQVQGVIPTWEGTDAEKNKRR
jgi:Cu(I)/Ag(I) efflux system membrane fusion protein